MVIIEKVKEIDSTLRKVKQGKIKEVASLASVSEQSVIDYILLLKEEGDLVDLSNGDKDFVLHTTGKTKAWHLQ